VFLLYGLVTEYGEDVHPMWDDGNGSGEGFDKAKDRVQQLYPFF